jgi:hypothetical protein
MCYFISVPRWLNRLSPHFRKLAMTHLSEAVVLPLRAKKQKRLASGVSGDGPVRLYAVCQLASGEGSKAFSLSTRNDMPIRVHASQLSDEPLLAKLGVKRRAKPRELERQHQVALIKSTTRH